MQNYQLLQAKRDLAEKSIDLLLKNWFEEGWIRENYHAETGILTNAGEYFTTGVPCWVWFI
jgi:hypothetical protein